MVERGVEMGTSSEVKLPGWLKPANRLIIALQRLGLAVGTMHLISMPGRKSSKIRTTLSSQPVEGQRYIVGGFERADWVKNARAAGWCILARGRKEERVRLVELPVEERASILREFPPQGTPRGPVLPPAVRNLRRSGGVRELSTTLPRVPYRAYRTMSQIRLFAYGGVSRPAG